jgi:carbon storage regulator CsrA
MLVLARRIGEAIRIAGDIRVAVVDVNGKRFRLGITAPLSVNVVREELLARSESDRASPKLARLKRQHQPCPIGESEP